MAPRLLLLLFLLLAWSSRRFIHGAESAAPTRILLDTDVDFDDVFALLYLLKQDRTQFSLEGVTISANAWADAGHAVNLIYDVLYMMDRDDVPVGVGGEGDITFEGSFSPDVGGYLPLIEQGLTTCGGCRYRQAVPPGVGGLLDTDSVYGLRSQFLPQGKRHYEPLRQPTVQRVMSDVLSRGPTVVILIGSHTNFATLLMTHPEMKRNVERIYVMGGGVRSSNPTGCCPAGSAATCVPTECGDRGNLFDATDTNPWAEFNMFSDPFAAYQVFHSGIPITLVPLDATNTIPISAPFLSALERNQATYEAQWVYKVLQISKDTWFDNNFNKEFFLWDSFATGVAVSGILTNHSLDKNKYCVLHYVNVTVITSNKPYDARDGSNPFFDNRTTPRFELQKDGVHSGHVQTGLQDPFCLVSGKKGKCQDGYTAESNKGGARMQVGAAAKLSSSDSTLFAFQIDFIRALNSKINSARFNFESQFRCYKEIIYKPSRPLKHANKSIIFDMDMSPGDIITLLYILKLPRHVIDLKAVSVSSTGWSNAATIDVIYDVLHMMGRDDIPVGLGEFFAVGQAYPPLQTTGDCKYRQWIPNGAGGFIDSDTVFGLARDLPRSPRRYAAESPVVLGAPGNAGHLNLSQLTAQEVIEGVLSQHGKGGKVALLTGGPLSNIAVFLASNSSRKAMVKEIFIAGGSVDYGGNLYTLPLNLHSEFNFFLDPQAAQRTLHSHLHTFLVPLDSLQNASLAGSLLRLLDAKKETPEARFVHSLLLTVRRLEMQSGQYAHTAKLLEEVLAAYAMVEEVKQGGDWGRARVAVEARGDVNTDGWTRVDPARGREIKYLRRVSADAVARSVADVLNSRVGSAVVASSEEQFKAWAHTCK